MLRLKTFSDFEKRAPIKKRAHAQLTSLNFELFEHVGLMASADDEALLSEKVKEEKPSEEQRESILL